MSRFLIAAALVAASTFGAVAQTAPVPLSSATQSEILNLLPEVDLGSITNAQYAQIVTLFSSSEDRNSDVDTKAALEVILDAQ
jgi:DNA-binding transcriptional regulator YbjK